MDPENDRKSIHTYKANFTSNEEIFGDIKKLKTKEHREQMTLDDIRNISKGCQTELPKIEFTSLG